MSGGENFPYGISIEVLTSAASSESAYSYSFLDGGGHNIQKLDDVWVPQVPECINRKKLVKIDVITPTSSAVFNLPENVHFSVSPFSVRLVIKYIRHTLHGNLFVICPKLSEKQHNVRLSYVFLDAMPHYASS